MPTGRNWLYFTYVNLGFILYIIFTYYLVSLQEIKENWPKYRCNPMYMPLSDDIQKDFTYCIQTVQSGYMGYLLQPLTYITSSLTAMGGNFTNQINDIRGMFNKIRTFTSSIIQTVFGVFLNLVIEFQTIIIGMKDLFAKTIGILVTLLYVMDGSLKTMNSAWKGPTGQLVRRLGKCFHPDTKLKLNNGTIVSMKNIRLGDILENGSIVRSTMQIDNREEPEPLYKISGAGVDNEDIFVTGSHLVFDKVKRIFIQVKDYSKAEKTDIYIDWFSCLITSNNNIAVGSQLFWDWEDHFIKY
jgi:hypothetical protein